jgi:hypothetical protein
MHDRSASSPGRYAVITYVREAYWAGVLKDDRATRELLALFRAQYGRRWIIDVKRLRTKAQILRYAGRTRGSRQSRSIGFDRLIATW